MTIRSRLLLLLLPPLIIFLILISYFFSLNWSREILNSFQSRLLSVVVTTAQTIQPRDVEWLRTHIHDPDIATNPIYQRYRQRLADLKQKLPITNIYIVEIEPVHEGKNGYRQLILLQAANSKEGLASQPPGEYDFSETDERQVYLTKKAFVTPIYETRKTHERFISAYAPILNGQGQVMALLGADVTMQEIDQKLQKVWFLILIGVCTTLACIVTTVFLIADRISKPVQKLNQAALEIAAGDYEANIQVEGPKEIVELAQTLRTMSECLVEHMSRLRESSLIRERMYGEYECALLLQHYMLQKVIDEFHNPHVRIRLISAPLSSLQQGLLFKIDSLPEEGLKLTLLEAQEPGFAGLFQLNQWAHLKREEWKDQSFIECQLLNHYTTLRYYNDRLPPPLVWSIKSQQFIERENHREIPLEDQDMIFLYNSRVMEHFKTEESVKIWMSRVLRHFAEDGLDVIHTMLTHELNFLAKKQQIKRNFQIISVQIK